MTAFKQIFRNSMLIMASGVWLLLACRVSVPDPSPPSNEEKKIIFEVVSKGHYSGYETKENLVITDKKAWESLWSKVHSNMSPVPALPAVNFNDEIITGVFMGTRNTGGYTVSIKEVAETKKNITVSVTETYPGPSCLVTQAQTGPYSIIRIPKTKKSIVFNTEQKKTDCK